jgi:hypothetical protein
MSTSYFETVRTAFETKLKTIKTASTTSSLIAEGTHTFTRDTGDGSFITDGWAVGMTGKIANSGANNGKSFTVSGTVAALVLTVTEALTAQTKAQVGSCVLTSTFRNNVNDVYERLQENYPAYPSLVLGFGAERLKPIDTAWRTYNAFVDCRIVCEISANAGLAATSTLVAARDSLVHDIFRCIADLYTENICASSGARWNIEPEPQVTVQQSIPDDETGRGWFGINLTLRIRNMDKNFDS